MEWNKNGDFSEIRNQDSDESDNRFVAYTSPCSNNADSKIIKIELNGYKDGDVSMKIKIKQNLDQEFSSLLDNAGIPVDKSNILPIYYYRMNNVTLTQNLNGEQEKLWKFLRVVDEFSPIDKGVIDDLSVSLGIGKPQLPSLQELCISKIILDKNLFVASMADTMTESVRLKTAKTFADKMWRNQENQLYSLSR